MKPLLPFIDDLRHHCMDIGKEPIAVLMNRNNYLRLKKESDALIESDMVEKVFGMIIEVFDYIGNDIYIVDMYGYMELKRKIKSMKI